MSKDYNKAYIDDNELGFIKEVIRPNFRKRGEYEVGDAVFWDSYKNLFEVASPENVKLITDKTRYIPTGVIAIPSSHDVYGTGEAGVVALKSASFTTPDEGQVEDVFIHGGSVTDYTELKNYTKIPYIDNNNGAIIGLHDDLNDARDYSLLIPTDTLDVNQNITDPEAYYAGNQVESNKLRFVSSPYLADGSRNPVYYQIEAPSSTSNALSDFNGKLNTEILCSKATGQPNWKTDDTIVNESTGGIYHPAACTCWRYHTVGTEHGDWYLPACGELGYCMVRRKKINKTITLLQEHFSKPLLIITCGDQIFNSIWSSTEYGSTFSRIYVMYSQGMTIYTRSGTEFVRPFTRLR